MRNRKGISCGRVAAWAAVCVGIGARRVAADPVGPTRVWTGEGYDFAWSNPANWLDEMLPDVGSDIEFPWSDSWPWQHVVLSGAVSARSVIASVAAVDIDLAGYSLSAEEGLGNRGGGSLWLANGSVSVGRVELEAGSVGFTSASVVSREAVLVDGTLGLGGSAALHAPSVSLWGTLFVPYGVGTLDAPLAIDGPYASLRIGGGGTLGVMGDISDAGGAGRVGGPGTYQLQLDGGTYEFHGQNNSFSFELAVEKNATLRLYPGSTRAVSAWVAGTLAVAGGSVTLERSLWLVSLGGLGQGSRLEISAGSLTTPELWCGNPGAAIRISGGVLSTPVLRLPDYSNVTMDQSNGVVSVGAFGLGSGCTYTLSGGDMNVSGGGTAAGAEVVRRVDGTFTQTGGSFRSGADVVIGDFGLFEVSGGSFSARSITNEAAYLYFGQRVRQTGGSLTLLEMTPSQVKQYIWQRYLFSSKAWDGGSSGPVFVLGYVYDEGSGAVSVRLAEPGDANLDGRVDADDLALLDRGFARHGSWWWEGDFDGDGQVTRWDYRYVDAAMWRRQYGLAPEVLAAREAAFGPGYVSELMATVPEPGSAGACVAIGVAWTQGRRRRVSKESEDRE